MNGLIMCTDECNLRCTYCFEESMHTDCIKPLSSIRKDFSFFIDNYLDKYVRELIDINKELNKTETHITFHGGEPLLVGSELLRRGFEIVSQYRNTVISIQTNGTLINDELIDLFKEYTVHVGVSLDGPEYMHDAYRKDAGGQGTYQRLMTNIKKMQEKGVIVGALATVTDVSVKEPDTFYRFFIDNHLEFSFNPCFTDPNLPSSYKVLNTSEYIDFYKRMFDLWVNDNSNNISINCFERIISAMAVKKKVWMEVCSFIPDCSQTTVAINTKGDFFRCLHYCMDGKHIIGNIACDPLSIAVGDPAFSERWKHLKQSACKECDIQDYCCGGCPYVAEAENGTILSRANTCLSQKAIVHHIYDYLLKYQKKQ